MSPGPIQSAGGPLVALPLPPSPIPIPGRREAEDPRPGIPSRPPYWRSLDGVNTRRPPEPAGESASGRTATDDTLPPYWQYLERFNARRAPAPAEGPARGASAPTETGGGASRCGAGCEKPSYAMPRLGDVSPTREPEPKRRVEEAYRREVTLPTGNAIDLLA
jgi:hypothetical protein